MSDNKMTTYSAPSNFFHVYGKIVRLPRHYREIFNAKLVSLNVNVCFVQEAFEDMLDEIGDSIPSDCTPENMAVFWADYAYFGGEIK